MPISLVPRVWKSVCAKFGNRAPYGVVVLGLFAVAIVWASVLLHLADERGRTEQAAFQNAANLTRTFEEHIVRTVMEIDQTLLFIRSSYQKDPDHFDIFQWSQANPLLADLLLQVSIIDKDGNRRLTSMPTAVSPASLSDRDYFQFQRSATTDELFISKPMIGRASGQWSIPVTRRIAAPDGSFAGVVVAALDPTYFARFYQSVDIGKLGAIILVGTDGIVRARAAWNDNRPIGQSLIGSSLMQHLADAPMGSYRGTAVVDGIVRLFTYRKVENLPLIVEVGFAEDEVLADYRHEREDDFIIATLMSVMLLGATVLFARRQVRLREMRDALSASERKYRSVLDNLHEVVFRTDLEGRWTFLNPAWTELTGFSVAESLGHTFFKYVEPQDWPLYARYFEPLLHGAAESEPQDFRFIDKDGALHWFTIDARATHDDRGKVIGLSGTLNDITQRKASEIKLLESGENLARAQRIAEIGSFDHDLVTNKVGWSDQLYRLYGMVPQQVSPNIDAVLSCVHPDDREGFLGVRTQLLQGIPTASTDFRFKRPDGVERIFHRQCDLVLDETGKPLRVFGTVQDITQRKEAELKLRQSREHLARAQRIAEIGSFELDLVTGKSLWSDQVYRIHGLDPAKVEADLTAILMLVHPEDRGKFMAFRDEASQGAQPSAVDFRIIRPDGAERILHRECDVTFDALDRPTVFFGTIQDVTERKRVEEALREARDIADRSARAKTDFLAMMSHEIRSPMYGVTGVIDLLRQTPLDAEQKKMVEMVHESGTSLLAILNDILDFSKIEAGRILVAPEPVELGRFIPSICENSAHAASRKGLSFAIEINDGIPDWITVDPVRLRQILLNLLSNAIKFTAQGSIRLVVAPVSDAAGKPMLTFTVTDTGIGMSAETITRLFQPFTQADASTTRNFGGTGLGLSISLRLAELLGGKVGVSSQPGIGSIFTLTLPLAAAAPPAATKLKEPLLDEGPSLGNRRLLVAEDLPTNRWLIARQLQHLGVTVDAVENGQAALAALAASSYDLLITDFHMPEMDGIALTTHIRDAEKRKGSGRLPILGLTADITGRSRERCLAAGMDGVVSKPTDLQSLGDALRRLLLPQHEAPTAPTANSSPGAVFDDRIYRELFEGDDPEGREWLAAFIEAAQALLPDIRAKADAMDRAGLAATAHRLAGIGLSAGAMRLGQSCRIIETTAADAKREDLLVEIATAEVAFHAASEEIARRIFNQAEVVS